ncbi:hypothetical protein J2X57_003745 [Luteibacter sp. 1214]|uniref:hypothetical protein n=1 Tax=Luteibacter sp. 1214 TaxID=2817735 RepID=UPI0028562AB0|nr:hypothetical protein [Luteibacter sp. 1214]MDR6644502.1 hypothetical protein [Luteibacter sp. 1214]
MKNVEVFKFGVMRWLLPIVSLGVIVFFVAAIVDLTPKDRSEHWFLVQVLFPFAVIFHVCLAMICRDVVISTEGIGRSFLGLRGRFLPWDAISSVDCCPLPSSDGKVKYYHLRCGGQRRRGGVTLWSAIDDVERLVSLIEVEIKQRKIPILKRNALDTGMVEMERMPSPVTDYRAWI